MDSTPVLRVPRKITGTERGRVISFASRDNQVIERSGLLSLIAREMMGTDIAVKEAAMTHAPAVLIMTDFSSAASDVAIFHNQYGYPSQNTLPTDLNLEEHVFGLIGGGYNTDFFTEFDFLKQIKRDPKSGVLVYEQPHNATNVQKEISLRWAEKYFDYVLVEYSSLPSKKDAFADYSLVVPEDVSIEKTKQNISSKARHHIDVGRSGHELMRSKRDLRIPSYANIQSSIQGPYSAFFSDTELTRFFVSDIARHILGVPLKSNKPLSSVHFPLFTTARNPNYFKRIAAYAGTLTTLPIVVGLPSAAALASIEAVGSEAVGVMLGAGGACIVTMLAALAMGFSSKRKMKDGSTYEAFKGITYHASYLDKEVRDIARDMPIPEEQEAVSFSGQILNVDVDQNAISMAGREKRAINSFLSPQRTPLGIAHAKAEDIIQQWTDYELDPIKFLEFPLMSDTSDPDIAEFYRLFSEMRTYRSMVREDPGYARAFVSSVTKAEKAFIIAEGKAKKMRDSYLDTRGQEKLREAHPFVSIMADDAASLNERTVAYEQASKILAGVIALPDETIKGLLSPALEGTMNV